MMLQVNLTRRLVGVFFLFFSAHLVATDTEAQERSKFKECQDCPEMITVPAGSFMMGSPDDEPQSNPWEQPRHPVDVQTFAISRTEVTFGDWIACVQDNGCSYAPAEIPGLDFPIVRVTWGDVQEYVQWLSGGTGETYRLPSEAEWEYAARAGSTGRFNTGNCITTEQANFDGREPATGCPQGIARSDTTVVASFPANAFGLYDTHGNVLEWVQDCWNNNYIGAPSDGSPWLTGYFDCTTAVIRGGSSESVGANVRLAFRAWGQRHVSADNLGFRVVRELDSGGGAPPNDPITLAPPPRQLSSDSLFDGSFEDAVSLGLGLDDADSFGWFFEQRSDPQGSLGWFLGNPEVFPAQAGEAEDYLAANFESTGDIGAISLWLFSPLVDFSDRPHVSFWTRSADSEVRPDRLEIRACTGRKCDSVGDSSTSVGDFTIPITTINRTLQANADRTGIDGYPDIWTRFKFGPNDDVPSSGIGRIAFRYFVTDAGLNGSNSSYIGIDTIRIDASSAEPPQILDFSVSPDLVSDGDQVEVLYSVARAKTCQAIGDLVDSGLWSGAQSTGFGQRSIFTIDEVAVGTYQIGLLCEDDRGQQDQVIAMLTVEEEIVAGR